MNMSEDQRKQMTMDLLNSLRTKMHEIGADDSDVLSVLSSSLLELHIAYCIRIGVPADTAHKEFIGSFKVYEEFYEQRKKNAQLMDTKGSA